jgi:hypothetical protein
MGPQTIDAAFLLPNNRPRTNSATFVSHKKIKRESGYENANFRNYASLLFQVHCDDDAWQTIGWSSPPAAWSTTLPRNNTQSWNPVDECKSQNWDFLHLIHILLFPLNCRPSANFTVRDSSIE